MMLLIYVGSALLLSFLCSIAEAVLLSVTPAYVRSLIKEKPKTGLRLQRLKADIQKPLAAILTLNTVAHTVGAAGAGAEAMAMYGDVSLALVSTILTILILVVSEIIPKTIGATSWRRLAPAVSWFCTILTRLMYPAVVAAQALTRLISRHEENNGVNKEELSALIDISREEGKLEQAEAEVIRHVLRSTHRKIADFLTPITVVFAVPESRTVAWFFHRYDDKRFSRIPVYRGENPDDIVGFVLRSDLLLAHARGNGERPIAHYKRPLPTFLDKHHLLPVLQEFVQGSHHMALVVNEFGSVRGIITLEDLLESILGMEITDESDLVEDMQQLARSRRDRFQTDQ